MHLRKGDKQNGQIQILRSHFVQMNRTPESWPAPHVHRKYPVYYNTL